MQSCGSSRLTLNEIPCASELTPEDQRVSYFDYRREESIRATESRSKPRDYLCSALDCLEHVLAPEFNPARPNVDPRTGPDQPPRSVERLPLIRVRLVRVQTQRPPARRLRVSGFTAAAQGADELAAPAARAVCRSLCRSVVASGVPERLCGSTEGRALRLWHLDPGAQPGVHVCRIERPPERQECRLSGAVPGRDAVDVPLIV